MKLPLSVSKTSAVVIVTTTFLGLGSGGMCSPQLTQASGYHTDQVKPSEAPSYLPAAMDESQAEQMLTDSLQQIKAGDLTAAAATLDQLVHRAPEDPRYSQLLALVRRQQQQQNWYRYQQRFQLGWASN